MRCYFMRDGRIAGVKLLDGMRDDATAIKRGCELFLDRVREGIEGIEIWERDRLVFRYPEEENAAGPTKENGNSQPRSSSAKKNKKAIHPRAMGPWTVSIVKGRGAPRCSPTIHRI